MAVSASVESLNVTQTVEYLGGTQSRQVAVCAVRTAPSLVYFEFRIPRASFTSAIARQEAEGYGAQVESVLTNPHVSGLEWWQNANDSGFLVDMATIFVRSTSGNSGLSFDVPWGHVFVEALSDPIATLAGQLDAAEKGSG